MSKVSCQRYTLVEMLIVTLIVAMLFAVILPKVTRSPRRMAVEQAQTTIRQVMMEAGSRARASGRVQHVLLQPADDGSTLTIQAGEAQNLSREWLPPMDSVAEGPVTKILNSVDVFSLPSSVVWQDADDYADDDGICSFVFYPDGQAFGPDLNFAIGDEEFLLSVDHITGRPLIQ